MIASLTFSSKSSRYCALVDKPAKPVRTMAVREMKMIPDEVGGIGLVLLGLRIGVEVCDCH